MHKICEISAHLHFGLEFHSFTDDLLHCLQYIGVVIAVLASRRQLGHKARGLLHLTTECLKLHDKQTLTLSLIHTLAAV